MYLLYRQLGAAATFVAAACIVSLLPINALLVRASASVQRRAMQHTDERTKMEGELVAGKEGGAGHG